MTKIEQSVSSTALGHGQTSWIDSCGITHKGNVIISSGGFDIIDCERCGFKHATPLPTAEELTNVYAHDYYETEKPLYIERYLEDKEWWDAVYQERYEILERNVSSEARSMLDVGSGPGLFLLKGRERGWQVKGVEPSSRAASYSRDELGLDVESVFMDTATVGRLGRFGAVNLGEVLEHLPDPSGMLGLVRGMLVENGMLCIVVPNDFNPIQCLLQEAMGFSPWWVAPPHHLNYFDRVSLSRLVEHCGFEVVHSETTFPIDLYLLMGLNYIGDDVMGRQVHGHRKQLEMNLFRQASGELKRKLYQSFAEIDIGREVVLYARKRG